MQVFVGWSGDLSGRIGALLKEWLPTVLQAADVWISIDDIAKGSRWTPVLAKALADSSFGIVCVVPDNATEPWLNFEVGALSKSLGEERVTPLLFGLSSANLPGPLAQFQSATCTRSDVLRLVQTINECATKPLPKDRVVRLFELCWPGFAIELDALLPEVRRGTASIISDDDEHPEKLQEKLAKLQAQFDVQERESLRIEEALTLRIEGYQKLLGRLEGKLESRSNSLSELSQKLLRDSPDRDSIALVERSRANEAELASEIEKFRVEQADITWNEESFHKGDRVRIAQWAGTFLPAETRHSFELHADVGRTGTFLGGVKRRVEMERPDEPIQLALVRRDRQQWTTYNRAKVTFESVLLESFVATIHATYLAPA